MEATKHIDFHNTTWTPPPQNVSLEEAMERNMFEYRILRQAPYADKLLTVESAELFNVPFCFTKGGDSYITGVFCKDLEAEVAFEQYLTSHRLNQKKLIDLYREYDPNAETIEYPSRHYPIRVLSAEQASLDILRWQVFSCPCFNMLAFELRDVREGINSQINLPQARHIFDDATLKTIEAMMEVKEQRTSLEFGHAILHEIGHYVYPVPIAPTMRSGCHLSGLALDFAGELATDALAGCILWPNIVQMSLYTFLVRSPGHWARRGFSEENQNAWVNSDNDSLVSAFCWGFFRERNVLVASEAQKWHVHIDKLCDAFREILLELGAAIESSDNEASQNKAVFDLARQYVPYGDNGFELQSELKTIFMAVKELPEVPIFTSSPSINVI